jgi:hypothetical protein
MCNKLAIFAAFFAVLASSPAQSSIEDYFPFSDLSSPSNYGDTGLLEIPNARFMKEASLRFNFSSSYPNEFTTITASPFKLLEASYRYTEIKNKLYGPSSYSGNQSLKDKGFDLKMRLIGEGYYRPAVALGLRDIAGTGIFSSEYLVATKSLGNFDVTAGLGWGKLGSDDSIRNPLLSLSESFQIRTGSIKEGGEFKYTDWFSGTTALFGGVEYHLRKYGLKLIAEYDSSRPDMSTISPVEVKSNFNLGLNYHLSNNLQLGLSFERGTNFRMSFSLKGNFLKDTISKPPPKNIIALSKEQKKKSFKNPDIFYRSLNKSLRDEKIFIQSATLKDAEVSVAIASSRFRNIPRMAGRSAAIISALASEDVERMNIHVMNGDLEIATLNINRNKFDAAKAFKGSPQEVLKVSLIDSYIRFRL